jgi:transketolase
MKNKRGRVFVCIMYFVFGKNPFVCAPACFLSARILEQIKVDVVYSKDPVRIIGVSGGVSYGSFCFTYLSLHETAIMRTFPEFSVIVPSDSVLMEEITEYLVQNNIGAYVRVGRGAVESIYQEGVKDFVFVKAITFLKGESVTIIATGEVVQNALGTAKLLKELVNLANHVKLWGEFG